MKRCALALTLAAAILCGIRAASDEYLGISPWAQDNVYEDAPLEITVGASGTFHVSVTGQRSGDVFTVDLTVAGSSTVELPPLSPDVYEVTATPTGEAGGESEGFVVAASRIAPLSERPAGFDDYWRSVAAALARLPRIFHLRRVLSESGRAVTTYKVSFSGLEGSRYYGWFCAPAEGERLPAVFVLPTYGSHDPGPPRAFAEKGFCALAVNLRGERVGKRTYLRGDYIADGVRSPHAYAYRDIVVGCLRGLDFLRSRPEVDASRIGLYGISQGGGLALFLAGLDPDIRAVRADAPFLCDWPTILAVGHWPADAILRKMRRAGERQAVIRRTLAYFDVAGVADRIKATCSVGVGLLDRTCPAAGVIAAFNGIAAEKEMRVFPDMGHATPPDYEQRFDWFQRHLAAPE